MTEDDRNLIVAIAEAIAESRAGANMPMETVLELASIAHHAIKERLPRPLV